MRGAGGGGGGGGATRKVFRNCERSIEWLYSKGMRIMIVKATLCPRKESKTFHVRLGGFIPLLLSKLAARFADGFGVLGKG